MIKLETLSLVVTNYFFDTNDYVNSVKVSYINDFSYRLIPGYELIKDVKVRVNHAEDWFSYLYSFSSKSYTYISVEKVDENMKVEDESNTVIKFAFYFDTKYTHIERKVFFFSLTF